MIAIRVLQGAVSALDTMPLIDPLAFRRLHRWKFQAMPKSFSPLPLIGLRTIPAHPPSSIGVSRWPHLRRHFGFLNSRLRAQTFIPPKQS